MPSFNVRDYYERGRKGFSAYAKTKRAHVATEKARERQFTADEAVLAHNRALELAGIQYGEGSPAMISARTNKEELGFKQKFLPWQEAMRYDLETRKAGGTIRPKRTDIQAIYKFEAADDFDASDPQSIAKANALREAAGMPLWVKGEDRREGLGIPFVSPSRTVPTYRQESEDEYRQRIGQGMMAPAPTAPPGMMTRSIVSAAHIPASQPPPQGFGTMKVEGQPGYYGINVPGPGGTPISPAYTGIKRYGVGQSPKKKVQGKEDWRRYLPKQ